MNGMSQETTLKTEWPQSKVSLALNIHGTD